MSNKLKKKTGPKHSLTDLQDIRVLIVAKALQANDETKNRTTSYLDLAYAAIDSLIEADVLTPRDQFITETPIVPVEE